MVKLTEEKLTERVLFYKKYVEENYKDYTDRRKHNQVQRMLKEEIDERAMEIPLHLDVKIEWKKSRTWGNNPTAELDVITPSIKQYKYVQKATGCGYCKHSDVLGRVMNNALKPLCWALYDKIQSGEIKKEDLPYGLGANEHKVYVVGGGIGVRSVLQAIRYLGYDGGELYSSNKLDLYKFEYRFGKDDKND